MLDLKINSIISKLVRYLFLVSPVVIVLFFIFVLRAKLGEHFFFPIDSNLYLNQSHALNDFGYILSKNNYGLRDLSEITNFYPHLYSYLFTLVGINFQYMQLSYIGLSFIFTFYVCWVSIYKFLLLLKKKGDLFASYIGAFFYTFNLQMLLFWSGGPGYSLSLLLITAPLILFYLIRALYMKKINKVDYLMLGLLTGVNLNTIPFNLAFLGLLILLFLLFKIKDFFINLKSYILWCLTSFITGASFIYTISFIYLSGESISTSESAQSYIFSGNGIRGLFQFFYNWTLPLVWDGAPAFVDFWYYNLFPIIILTFLTWSIVLWNSFSYARNSNILNSKKKIIYFLLSIILLSIFLAKGDQSPFGNLNRFIYEKFPLFRIFRTPDTKFGFPIIVSFSFLISFSLYRVKNFFIKILIILFLISQFIPFLIGNSFFGHPLRSKTAFISNEIIELVSVVNDSNENGLVLFYPGRYSGRFVNDTGSLLGQDVVGKLISNPVIYYQHPRLPNVLGKDLEVMIDSIDSSNPGLKGIRYIIIREDFLDLDPTDKIKLTSFKKNIDNNNYLNRIYNSSNFIVYKTNSDSFQPLITLNTGGYSFKRVEYEYINPTKYTASIPNFQDEYELNFLNIFSKYWDLKGDFNLLNIKDHALYYDVFNRWELKQVGVDKSEKGIENKKINVILEYVPQKGYFIFSLISWISTITLIIMILIVNIKKSTDHTLIDENS